MSVSESLEIPCVTPIQIFSDLTDCVTTCNTKIKKRLARLRIVCKALNINADTYIDQLVIPQEKVSSYTTRAVLDFVSKTIPTESTDVYLPKDGPDDGVKKFVEARLTSSLNSDLGLYRLSSNIMRQLYSIVRKDSILGPLVDAGRIILVHKGGIAQRLVMCRQFPHLEDDIKTAFSLGGDNDCNILIDPQLNPEQYAQVRSQVLKVLHTSMMDLLPKVVPLANEYASKFNTIVINDTPLTVESTTRRSFTLSPHDDKTVHLNHYGPETSVYISFNKDIKFVDEIGRLCHFTLLRYKKAFKVNNRVLGAEILDISIPFPDEEKAADHFHHYSTGQWVQPLTLSQ